VQKKSTITLSFMSVAFVMDWSPSPDVMGPLLQLIKLSASSRNEDQVKIQEVRFSLAC
jgi:hypothetical protein